MPLSTEDPIKRNTTKITLLTPIVAAITITVLITTLTLFYFETENQRFAAGTDRITKTQLSATKFYQSSVDTNANAIYAIMSALKKDKQLEDLFQRQDRNQLLDYTRGLYTTLNHYYNITHFYFSTADRINLLRVHKPETHGDQIDRITTLRASATGKPSHGVELGVLGTFTLRVVMPWHDRETNHLIGYIELGMEIDHAIQWLSEVFNSKISVIISKQHLNRGNWESGMKMLGRDANWERLENYVVSSIDQVIPEIVESFLDDNLLIEREVQFVEDEKHSYWLLTVPIKVIEDNNIAYMVLLSDASEDFRIDSKTIFAVGVSVFSIAFILVMVFYWLIKRLSKKIEKDTERLNELATTDSLTGLYTRRVFDRVIESEVLRSLRFHHDLSLVIIDIDHFKQINDRHGHPVGDQVLFALSNRISAAARKVDYCCRYGGEELAIILPETSLIEASEFGNRILKMISDYPIYLKNGTSIPVTVSIGIATCPKHGDTVAHVVASADAALYQAKQNGRNHVCVAKAHTSNRQ
jgi:diguanylate cyclase (GGDEF)-like protein